MSFLNKNNPVWSSSTKTTNATVAGGYDEIAGRDGVVTVSNHGPANLFVGTTQAAATGILLQPGAALTLGLQPGVTIYLNDASNTAVYSLVEY